MPAGDLIFFFLNSLLHAKYLMLSQYRETKDSDRSVHLFLFL